MVTDITMQKPVLLAVRLVGLTNPLN